MTDLRKDQKRAKDTLHEINARVQANPQRKLEVIKAYYAEHSSDDVDAADMALIVKDIIEAGGNAVDQTSHLRAATPVLIVGMVLGSLVSVVAILGGIYAVYKSATASTQINLWGATVSTGSVGVGFVFLGAIGLVLIVRAAFKRTALVK